MTSKRYLILSLLIFGLTSLTFAQKGKSNDWTEKSLQKLYVDYLESEGISPTIDSDGDIQFKYERYTYFIDVDESDTEFFRIVLYNVWPIESVTEALQVTQACSYVNRKIKCVKIYPTTNDNVWVSTELFVGSPEDFKDSFWRCIKVINDGTTSFAQQMKNSVD
ncbi:MAG: YbjN domain-containing protein [Bacteroidota bacterium]